MQQERELFVMLHYAALVLNAQNADGATQENGVGYNKPDTRFGELLAATPPEKWSDGVAYEAWRMLAKYRGQLRNHGINYDAIPVPLKPNAEWSRQNASIALQVKHSTKRLECADADGVVFHFLFPYDDQMNAKANALGIFWSSALRLRKICLTSRRQIPPIMDFAKECEFDISDHALSRLMELSETLPDVEVNVDTRPKISNKVWEVDEHNLVLTFGYNQAMLDDMKRTVPERAKKFTDKLQEAVYGTTKGWEVSLRYVQPGWHLNFKAFLLKYSFEVSAELYARLSGFSAKEQETIRQSSAQESNFTTEIELLRQPYAYQFAGVEFLVQNHSAIVADQPGLGKTIQAIVATHHLSAYPALVVVPKSLKENWRREWKLSIRDNVRVFIGSGKLEELNHQEWDVLVINYDILQKNLAALSKIPWRVLVCDEAHALKDPTSQRSKAVSQLAKGIKHKFLLTGTPITNKPLDLIPLLTIIGKLDAFGGKKGFTERYCPPVLKSMGGKTFYTYPYATNLPELNAKLRASGSMIRRLKLDVLKDLPAKRFAILPIDLEGEAADKYRAAEEDICKFVADMAEKNFSIVLDESIPEEERDGIVSAEVKKARIEAAQRAARAEVLVKMAKLREIAAQAKLPGAIEWIEEFLESGEKLVVFAWHQSVIKALQAKFKCGVISGDVSLKDRQATIDSFQNDSAANLIVLNIKAGGIGITLTASSNVLFLEYPWTPSDFEQAADRVHRIGQENAVTVWTMVIPYSMDERMATIISEKAKMVGQSLDKEQDDGADGATSALADFIKVAKEKRK